MQQTDQKINSGNQFVENSAKRLVRQLLTDNYSRYYSLAYSYVRNEEDAMDIVQEGAYKALRNSGSLRNPEYAGTWIYRIMIHTALDFVRKKKTEPECMDIQELGEGAEDSYEDFDLERAVKGLEESSVRIIRLYFFEELTLSQIARLLHINENTVKSRLYRALKHLKICMEQ